MDEDAFEDNGEKVLEIDQPFDDEPEFNDEPESAELQGDELTVNLF